MSGLFNFIVSKDTAFYYWFQAISGWHIPHGEERLYDSYLRSSKLTEQQVLAVEKVRDALLMNDKPRGILADLYLGINNHEVIKEHAKTLRESFDKYWQAIEADLNSWRDDLATYDFADIEAAMQKVVHFLRADEIVQGPADVYLLPNSLNGFATGHVLRGYNFILLHPAHGLNDESMENTLTTLLHEYIHVLEFSSPEIGEMLKESFLNQSENESKAPDGYSWKSIASEVLAYCFANNITGGYFRPFIDGRDTPTVDEFQDSYNRMLAKGFATTNRKIGWISLISLPSVQERLESGLKFDKEISDEIMLNIFKYI